MNARPLWIALCIGILVPACARAETVDEGSFQVYRHDQSLGAETFLFMQGHDSLAVMARQYLTLQTPDGAAPLERDADLLVNRFDFSLRSFTSERTFQGQTIKRGITVADTHYVTFRQNNEGGEGVSYVLPPGRIYVMDSQLITMFDLICRSFQDRAFKSRDINLLALGPRDTMLTAHAKAVGTETIQWAGQPVSARKLLLQVDNQTTFTLWIGSKGRLLRLLEPIGGLRAERSPPESKTEGKPESKSTPPPRPGG
jgi:hypothetical protein